MPSKGRWPSLRNLSKWSSSYIPVSFIDPKNSMPLTSIAKHLILPLALLAASKSAAGLDCGKAITTPDINQCASIEQKKVEANLNKVYQRVLKSLGQQDAPQPSSAAMRTSFIAAQRAWIKFREADCDAVYQKYADGTIRTVMYIGCMQHHAERRIKDLEAYESE
ncbi:lysozyme inhibitor LprI family protein [Noviherbaspirillum sp. CPCC 100848]|uniref:Lysozyme inhibitor LprI family protein n=1 Tax=Noviherbaspirillum album TaxID=3080276 RepID=A0ABU6JGB5_9BURK|nr:lysozyme inhibitor LprI family protein [Noviherbaspirillum sp. CPCC 100848]MEC4722565.1 lysozyme inhibitor LprI family protein [Noviherbaspirillum sp. CPCC 100848]